MIFFLIIPPPPISTLFPYTTLFRSVSRSCSSTGCTASPVPNTGEVAEDPYFVDRPPVRKSTRVKSSHMTISFAVLFLTEEKWLVKINNMRNCVVDIGCRTEEHRMTQ